MVSEDFSTPNEAYFAQADYVISKAREKGMLVMLTPAYLGFDGGDQGWYQAMGTAGHAKLEAYGQYVATRFQQYDNIMWVHGGDYNPPDKDRMRAVVDGIRAIETTSLHTFHGSRGTAALQWLGTSEAWLNVNNIYTDKNTVVAEAQGEYERATMPFFLIEDSYENESANGTETRQQAWQAVLSGAAGQLRGEAAIWRFNSSWKSSLNTEGASTMIYLRNLLESYEWWTLVPDFNNNFLTAGYGSGALRAPASAAADGSFALVYTRDVRDLTVDRADSPVILSGLAGMIRPTGILDSREFAVPQHRQPGIQANRQQFTEQDRLGTGAGHQPLRAEHQACLPTSSRPTWSWSTASARTGPGRTQNCSPGILPSLSNTWCGKADPSLRAMRLS
ncbi:MAG: DUF4038 domain-containing protein [Gammaproteobacteria bacterium]